jgi:hypothetical protein
MKDQVYTFDEQTEVARAKEVVAIAQAAKDAGRKYHISLSRPDGWFRAIVTVYAEQEIEATT